jgi:hypothetical protein
MNRMELKQVLDGEKFNPKVYSLEGGCLNDRLCISAENGRWVCYYTERGSRYDEQWFETEDEACKELLRRLRELPSWQAHIE